MTKNELFGNSEQLNDLIERQDAIDAVRKAKDRSEAHRMIVQVPSAQPERKTGRWIKTARWGRVYYCDQCRNYLDFDGVNAGRGSTNFCPNCGAKMLKEGE